MSVQHWTDVSPPKLKITTSVRRWNNVKIIKEVDVWLTAKIAGPILVLLIFLFIRHTITLRYRNRIEEKNRALESLQSALKKKNDRYVNIDETKFETNKGVVEALDSSTGETVIVKAITLQNSNEWKKAQREAETLRGIGKFLGFGAVDDI